MAEVYVGKRAELKDGSRRIVKSARGEIGVFAEDGALYAYANMCAHQGGPACEGLIMKKVVDVIAADRTYQGQTFSDSERNFVCPWHGWEYDLKTGECIGNRRLKIKKYEVVTRGDDIYVIV